MTIKSLQTESNSNGVPDKNYLLFCKEAIHPTLTRGMISSLGKESIGDFKDIFGK